MTYDARDLSSEDGAPIMLVVFAIGAKTWRFAQSDRVVTLDGHDYLPVPMNIGEVRQSGDVPRNDLTIKVPFNFPIANLWRVSPPTGTVVAIVKEVHQGDTDIVTSWLGHVGNVSWPTASSAEIRLTPGIVAMNSTGLRRLWQRGCPHVVYQVGDGLCNLDREAFREPGTVTSNVGLTLQAAVFGLVAAGEYNGGYIEWTDADGVTDWRFIVSHTGTTVELNAQAPLLEVADSFDAFVGCNRTLTRCDQLGNSPNYGGIPHFATRNPFDGQPVY